MKYAILADPPPQKPGFRCEAFGFHQWLQVFKGKEIRMVDVWSDGDYDVIHLRLNRANLEALHQLRERIGETARTKLVVSVDLPSRYWESSAQGWGRLKAALFKADLVLATNFRLAQAITAHTGRKVYELPHPANLEQIEAFKIEAASPKLISIVYSSLQHVRSTMRWVKLILGRDQACRILSIRQLNSSEIEFFRKKKLELILCQQEAELMVRLAESQMVLIPETVESSWNGNDGDLASALSIYCAALGTIGVGTVQLEPLQRCYPELFQDNLNKSLRLYRWLRNDAVKMANVKNDAKVKVEYYQAGNLQKRFLDLLYQEHPEPRFFYRVQALKLQGLFQQIHYLSGAETVCYHQEEVVVVCLVKNGAEYIPTFLDHYRRLGVKHFFLIDNGSTDATLRILMRQSDVTLYQTELPHKNYECEIRRAVIEEHCRNHWCLCVDIDELFVYPYQDRVALGSFLRYLNTHRYTAVLSYLLDLFARHTEFTGNEPGDLVGTYCYYDISNLKKTPYQRSFIPFSNFNRLADRKMKNYSGGIRRSVFPNQASGYLLTKHPLIFVDHQLEPFVHPHFSNKACVADVNGVLKHYKFISTFKERVINRLEQQEFCYYGDQEYQEYLRVIKDRETLSLYSPKAHRLSCVEQLVAAGFLKASRTYRNFINQGPVPV